MFSKQLRGLRLIALVGVLALANLLLLPAMAQTEDDPIVEVVATDAVATEEGPTTGTFTFTRTGSTAATLDIAYTVSGTATAGVDYVALSGVATFAVGESTVNVTVLPIDDAVAEPDETVIVTLTAGAAYTLGASTSATVTIIDNDQAAPTEPPSDSKDACKQGGWEDFGVFKNQGDCVSFVATKGKNPPAFANGEFAFASVAAEAKEEKPGRGLGRKGGSISVDD